MALLPLVSAVRGAFGFEKSYRQGASSDPRIDGFGAVRGTKVLQHAGNGLEMAIFAEAVTRVGVL